MTLSCSFDAPIPLPDGGEITTLREAGEYVTALPAKEHDKPHWQTAMQHMIDEHKITPGSGKSTGFYRLA